MGTKFDGALQDMDDFDKTAPKPRGPVLEGPLMRTKFDNAVAAMNSTDQISPGSNSTWGQIWDDLKTFAKFGGHGISRGLAEDAGLPVDTFNMAAKTIAEHPENDDLQAQAEGGAAFGGVSSNGDQRVNTDFVPAGKGSTAWFRKYLDGMGLTTSSSEEEGVKGNAAARLGDTLGEFTGANLPFIAGAPAKIATDAGIKLVPNAARILAAKNPFMALVGDLAGGAWGPGLGAFTGQEVVGEDASPGAQEAAKGIGALAGGLRLAPFTALDYAAKKGASWLQSFLVGPKAGEARAGAILGQSMVDPAAARAALDHPPEMSPGAKIMTGNLSGDDGLLALQRTVIANDAQLSGDYKRAIGATEQAIQRDAQLSPSNFASVRDWLSAKMQRFTSLVNQRLQNAVDQAESDTYWAMNGAARNPVEATQAKAAYAQNLKAQILLAQDDSKAVVDSKWANVDKSRQVDTAPLYDEVNTMKAEHASRPAESDSRFPWEFINKLFQKPQASAVLGSDGKPMATLGGQTFGPSTPLQNVVDLNSEVQQAMRVESAKDAPDRVYMAYMTRLSKALQNTMGTVPGAEGDAMLKDALAATRTHHETFSQGPVGQVLGHDVPGAPDIPPSMTIKHFLAQGPAGVDSMNALMRAIAQRTGETGAMPGVTAEGMRQTLRDYLRQDFYDNSMANGTFNQKAAQRWMSNNAGAIGDDAYADLRREFQGAIQSNGNVTVVANQAKKDIEDLQNSRANLFLSGKPGMLFNGAVNANDKYAATKELVGMVADDPTGRAFQGLKQMAFDKMVADSIEVTHGASQLERINGAKMSQWFDENKGVFQALDEHDPGTMARAQRITDTAKMLERYHVNPNMPITAKAQQSGITALGNIAARILGADVFTRFGFRGGSIQTAAIGSQAAQNAFSALSKLNPDQALKATRRALVDPDYFKLITTPITKDNAGQVMNAIKPYFYSMGIPIASPMMQQDQEGQNNGPTP